MTKRATLIGEAGRLRRHTQDLSALAALTKAWADANRDQVVESLADTLLEQLDLEFVYVSATSCERVRTSWGERGNGLVVNLRPLLAPRLRPDADPTGLVPDPRGKGTLRFVVAPLGDPGKGGVVLCASRQEDFPSEEDRLLLEVAVTQAAVVLDARSAEEALRRERDELADFVDNATIGLHRVGPDGTILWANQAELNLLGYPREEYIGRNIADFHADPDTIEDILRRLGGQEELHDCEARLRRKDGSIRHVSISSNVFWKDGRFVHTRCFTRDITEEARARQALAESEERLRRIVKALPAAVYTCDARGRITHFNEAAVALWGREPRIGEDRWCGSCRIYRPDGTPLSLDECPMAVALREVRSVRGEEIVIERPDGSRRHVLACPEPLLDAGGGLAGAVNMLVDITERKSAERRLATEHAVTRVLAEAGSFEEAAPAILEALRDTLGAEVCGLWLPGPAGQTLRCIAYRPSEVSPLCQSFCEQTSAATIPCGEGLPGRVWQSLCPTWIADVATDANFPRADAAARAGLRSGVGFPILIGDEFFGVIDFFFNRPLAPDPAVLNMMAAIGSEIGQFIQRTRVEAELARFKFITDHSVEALALLDRDARHVYVNQTHCRLHGYTAEELLRLRATDLNPSLGLAEYQQVFDASQEGEVAPYETLHRRKDGSTFPVEIAQTGVRFGGVPYAFMAKRDITDRKQAEQAVHLLAEAGAVLAGSLDYEVTLSRVAGLVVPTLADWFAIDLVREDGSLGLATVAHSDPEKVELARDLRDRYPPRPDTGVGACHVVRTGKSELFPVITDRILEETAQDGEHLRITRSLGLRSAVIVPLVAQERTIGALTLVAAESGRQYSAADLPLVEELARRCAQAVESARLYREAQREIVERVAAQKALAESEERLRFTLDAARVGTWDWDMDTNQVRWSDNLEAIHGLTPGTFDGSLEGVLHDVHPEDRERVRQAIGGAVENGGDYRVEYRLAPQEDESRWVEGIGRVLIQDGRPRRMSGICMDVTARKQAEEALRKSERIYRGIGEALDYGIWICDAAGRNLYASQSFLDLVGLTQEECSEFGWGKVLHPDDAHATISAWKECARTGQFWEREHRFRGVDGQWHPILARGVPIRDERDEIICWAGLNLDIGNLKRTEEQLRERTGTLEVINRINITLAGQLALERLVQDVTEAGTQLSGAQFGAFFYNVENEQGEAYALYALAGLPREEFARFPMPRNTAIFAPTFRGEKSVRLDDVTRDPRYGLSPPYHGMPEGHAPVRSYLAVPVVSRSGKVHGGLFFGHRQPGVFTEQAEQLVTGIAAQAAVAFDNARLFEAAQKEIAQRRHAEEELELARATAEAASRAKSEFLAKMSHELRTPLNAVIGMSRMLQTRRFGGLTDKQADYLHDIRIAGEHLLNMINDILDLSKVEAGHLELTPVALDVTEIVGETLSPLSAIAEGKRIRLDFQPPEGGGEIFHDKSRFNQVLFNLLSNALKFTPEGGRVTVRSAWVGAVAPDAATVSRALAAGLRIDVEDTGVGIDPGQQALVWESFRQLKVDLPRPVEGTGLGLPLCRQLVRLMGGVIWLTSRPGRGSSFSFILPLRQPVPPPTPPSPPEASPRREGDNP